MNCKEANDIQISSFLYSLGIKPIKISGNSYWYLSPLRIEKTPSFRVDIQKNLWRDYGIAEGGTLVDLGTKMLKISIPSLLTMLSRGELKSFSFQQPETSNVHAPEISKVGPLANKALTSYLEQRGIPLSIAKEYCEEIYYGVKDKHYFAIAFKNDSGGYELRNKYMKLCLNKKDITSIIKPDSSRVILFEGFLDFLTWLKISEPIVGPDLDKTSFIILNSVSQIERAKTRLLSLPKISIEAFFDNDEAGRKCFMALKNDFPETSDRSILYKQFKDLNEMIIPKNVGVKNDLNREGGLSM